MIYYCVQSRSLHTVYRTISRILRLMRTWVVQVEVRKSLVTPVSTYLTTMLARYTRFRLQTTHLVDVGRRQNRPDPTPAIITDIWGRSTSATRATEAGRPKQVSTSKNAQSDDNPLNCIDPLSSTMGPPRGRTLKRRCRHPQALTTADHYIGE
jgi:hypothetical protein